MDAIAQRIIQRSQQQKRAGGIANDPIAQRVLQRAKGQSQIPAGVNRETFQRVQNIQKPTGAAGLAQNFKTDFGSFAKGMLGLGRQAITHPIDTGGKVLGIGKELVKGIPAGAMEMASQYRHPIDNFNKGYDAFQQLRQIPLDQQKKGLQDIIQKIGESPEAKANPDKRRMAQIGLAILGNYSQYSRPKEKIYNEPFSFALDAIPVAKTLGAGKAVSFAGKQAQKIPVVAKAVDKASEIFVPGAKLKNLGYGKVADDLQNTGTNMRKAQEGIIKSTVGQFEDLSKTERTQFFDAIDSLRRTPDVIPTHPNPKVQAKIDWYMKEELPRIRGMAGYKAIEIDPQNPLASTRRDTFINPSRLKKTRLSKAEEVREAKRLERSELAQNKQLNKSTRQNARGEYQANKEMALQANEFVDPELGSQFQIFKTLAGRLRGKSREALQVGDVDSLKNTIGKRLAPEELDRLFYSTEKSENEVLDMFRGMLEQEQKVKSMRFSPPEPVPFKPSDTLQTAYQSEEAAIEAANRQIVNAVEEGNRIKDTTAPIQNYLHHFFSPSKETKMGSKLATPQRGFLKKSADVEGYVKDPVVSIAGVKSKAATANIKEGFIQRVTKQYARPADTVTEFKNGTILAKDTGEPLIKWKGQYLPKDLGEELLRYEGKGKGIMDTMLTPLRVFNQNWKPLATAVRPRYHLRNIIGNVYNASFVGNANPKRFIEGAAQQLKGHIASNMNEGTFAGQVYKTLFKTPPEHKYIKMAAQDDVIGRGFFAADINDLAEVANTTEDFSKAIAKMENPAMIYRVPVLRQWLQASSAIGQAFEDNARLALYIDQLKKGASRATAKAYVNKHLFDYLNGLGEGDRAIKAIIPFWSWTRFNVPLQYGALWKNPIRNVVAQEFGKPYVQQNEANNPEYQYLPQREKDMGSVKIGEVAKGGKTYDKYMRTQGVLPIQDIAKIADPDNAGVSPLFGMLKQAKNMAFPPDSPQENLDYFGKPVENFPGEVKQYLNMPVRGTAKEILNSIPAIGEINKAIGGSYPDSTRPDLASRMETVLSPTSSTLQDREANKRYYYQDIERKTSGNFNFGLESDFKYAVKTLIQRPDDTVANKNLKTLTTLLRQNGFSEDDIQKSIREALKTFRSDMPKRGIKMDTEELMMNLDKIKTKPFFTP